MVASPCNPAILSTAAVVTCAEASSHAQLKGMPSKEQLAESGSPTGNVGLSDTGQVGSLAAKALSELLDSCLIELAGVQRRDDTSELELLCICVTGS